MTLLVGIFVGGQSKRMGGVPKGLLQAPGVGQHLSLVERLLITVERALPTADVALVGKHAAYANLGVRQLTDSVLSAGPLAGLSALCTEAAALGKREILALACDLPYLQPPLLVRLAGSPLRTALAPRVDGRWQPFCARYSLGATSHAVNSALKEQRHSLQALLDTLRAEVFELADGEAAQLRDWDAPEDVIS